MIPRCAADGSVFGGLCVVHCCLRGGHPDVVGGPRGCFRCEERWLKSGSNSPVEVGSLSHCVQGFIHPKWSRKEVFHQVVSQAGVATTTTTAGTSGTTTASEPFWSLQLCYFVFYNWSFSTVNIAPFVRTTSAHDLSNASIVAFCKGYLFILFRNASACLFANSHYSGSR